MGAVVLICYFDSTSCQIRDKRFISSCLRIPENTTLNKILCDVITIRESPRFVPFVVHNMRTIFKKNPITLGIDVNFQRFSTPYPEVA